MTTRKVIDEKSVTDAVDAESPVIYWNEIYDSIGGNSYQNLTWQLKATDVSGANAVDVDFDLNISLDGTTFFASGVQIDNVVNGTMKQETLQTLPACLCFKVVATNTAAATSVGTVSAWLSFS